MNKTLKASKYIIMDYKKAILTFYTVILLICVMMIAVYMNLDSKAQANMNFAGFGSSVLIFIFIAGLNSFKSNFKFMQANNISRKRFFVASIITVMLVAALMAFVDIALNNILKQIVPIESIYEQLYNHNSFFGDFLWSFALFAFTGGLGFFITILYYKCNKLMKFVISFVPILTIIILVTLDSMVNGIILKSISNFMTMAMGLKSHNSYIAVFCFFVSYAVISSLCYLLLRRISIKD